MATKTFKSRIQNKHDTEAHWNAAVNFKPLAGELIIYDEDNTHSTPRFKVGDGNTLVNNLPFVNGSMKFGADSFSYKDSVGNIGTFGPISIELNNSTYKAVYDTTSIGYKNISTDVAYDLNFPTKSGTFAVTSDIDVTAAGNNTFTGSNTYYGDYVALGAFYPTVQVDSGILKVGQVTSNNDTNHTPTGTFASSTDYGNGGITYRPNTTTHITYMLPSQAGTLALKSDIPIKTATLSGTTLSITLS